MNFDDILGKLMPLFEQKMAFSMEMSKRAMSLEEKKEASKTDLEYRKLEAQITNDKDKLTWEKEKLTTAIRGDYDLQTLKNNGTLDVKRLEGLNERDKQKIVEEGLNRRADQTNRTEQEKGYLTTLGTILGHAVEKTGTDAEGKPYSTKPTADVGTAARSLMEQTGLAKPAATPQARNVAGEAEAAAGVLREHEKAGTTDAARKYLNSLPADTRQATLALLNPGNVTTPATGVAPVAPVPEARPLLSTGQPAASQPVEPARPAVQTAAPIPPVVDTSRPVVQPNAPAGEWRGLDTEMGRVIKPMPIYDHGAAGSPNPFGSVTPDLESERKKKEALRRARGLTVGGF